MAVLEPQEHRTETIQFRPLRLQRADALAVIEMTANAYQLQIVSTEETRRPLTVEVRVTVSGAFDDIVAFANATSRTRPGESRRTKIRRAFSRALEDVPWT